MQRRVIVGIDGPAVDPNLMRTAIALARGSGAVLYAVDVLSDRANSARAAKNGVPRMQNAYFALSEAGELPDDLDARIVVIEGELRDQLPRLANRRSDLLVVGPNAAGNQSSDELNEAIGEYVAKAKCTVVVVPPDAAPSVPGIEQCAPKENDGHTKKA